MRRSLIHTTLIAAFALLPISACAQRPDGVEVRPGSPLLDVSRVTARTDTFEVRLDSGDTFQLVILTAALGDSALLRVERTSYEGREFGVDSFAVRRATLAPLFAMNRGTSEASRVTFSAGRAQGTVTPVNGKPRAISEPLSAPVFYSNAADMVLAALPLEVGRSYTLRMWDPSSLASELRIRVAEEETIATARGGACTALRVETEDGEGNSAVYWVEKTTHAFLGHASDGSEIRIVHHVSCPGQTPAVRESR